jgi:hypothetical protein
MPAPIKREIIIECAQFGNSVRVTAIDAESGTEVTFQAPLSASKLEMERTAVNKLNYVMKKKKT